MFKKKILLRHTREVGEEDVHLADLEIDEEVHLEVPEAEVEVRDKYRCQVCKERMDRQRLHFGGYSCYSCRAFFRRFVALQKHIGVFCSSGGRCEMKDWKRKQCKSCRFLACVSAGMRPDKVLTNERKVKRFHKKIARDGTLKLEKSKHRPAGRMYDMNMKVNKNIPKTMEERMEVSHRVENMDELQDERKEIYQRIEQADARSSEMQRIRKRMGLSGKSIIEMRKIFQKIGPADARTSEMNEINQGIKPAEARTSEIYKKTEPATARISEIYQKIEPADTRTSEIYQKIDPADTRTSAGLPSSGRECQADRPTQQDDRQVLDCYLNKEKEKLEISAHEGQAASSTGKQNPDLILNLESADGGSRRYLIKLNSFPNHHSQQQLKTKIQEIFRKCSKFSAQAEDVHVEGDPEWSEPLDLSQQVVKENPPNLENFTANMKSERDSSDDQNASDSLLFQCGFVQYLGSAVI